MRCIENIRGFSFLLNLSVVVFLISLAPRGAFAEFEHPQGNLQVSCDYTGTSAVRRICEIRSAADGSDQPIVTFIDHDTQREVYFHEVNGRSYWEEFKEEILRLRVTLEVQRNGEIALELEDTQPSAILSFLLRGRSLVKISGREIEEGELSNVYDDFDDGSLSLTVKNRVNGPARKILFLKG